MKSFTKVTTIVSIYFLALSASSASAGDLVAYNATTNKVLSLSAAESRYERALLLTDKWLISNPFTKTEIYISKGKKLQDEQLTVDRLGNIRIMWDGKVVEQVVEGYIYTPPKLTILDTLEERVAKSLNLDFDKNWAKKSFEERWLNNVPEIYGYQIREVEDSYRADAVSTSSPPEMLFNSILDPKASAVWYGKTGDSSSGTLKISRKASKSQEALLLTILLGKGIISSIVLREGTTETRIRYFPFVDILQAPKGPYADFDVIRQDRGYQIDRSRELAGNIVYKITRDAYFLAAFELLDKPDLRNWRDAVDSFPGVTIYDDALELSISYGGNSYLYCAPNMSFKDAGDLILDGSCSLSGFTG